MARVLVVDDEPDIVELIRINLELEGHDVTVARNGEEALAAVRHDPPDAVFLDVGMPGIDGWTVLTEIKGSDSARIARTPVFMVTAKGQPEDRLRGGIEGALRYLVKPFDAAELGSILDAALADDAPPEPEQRRRVQVASLEEVARRERRVPTGAPASEAASGPAVRLTRLERTPTPARAAPDVAAARARLDGLTATQRRLLDAVAADAPITAVADDLGVSRGNVYSTLRRIVRTLGVTSTEELLALARSGAFGARDRPEGPGPPPRS